jgi:hypothetical protein
MFLVESISSSFIPGVARFMPGGLGLALAGNVDKSATIALLVLVCYAAVASAAGWLATLRRDVA